MSNSSQFAYLGTSAIGRAIQLYLSGQIRSLEKIAPDLDMDDPSAAAEAVHDLRVTCQQMRSVLQAFSGFLPEKPIARLGKRIRNLQRQFGDVRDRHILLGQPELPPTLRLTLEAQQADAMRSLRHDLDSRRLCRRLEKLRTTVMDEDMEIALNPKPLTGKGAVQLRRLDAVIPAVLYRLAADITAYRAFIPNSLPDAEFTSAPGMAPAAAPETTQETIPETASDGSEPQRFWMDPSWPAPAVLHRLRLSWKHLRHVLMMLCPVWGDLGNDLIGLCKGMQDRLGLLHDRLILVEALLAHAAAVPADAAAVAAAWPGLRETHRQALQAFLGQWRDQDMVWFHDHLQPLIEWSVQQSAHSQPPCIVPQEDKRPDDRVQPEIQPLRDGGQTDGMETPAGPSLDDGRARDARLAAIYSEESDDWPE